MLPNGYIFLCSDITEAECFERNLFGGKAGYAKRVSGLKPGDHLFLYNYNSKQLHGVFTATSELANNLVPDAWQGEFPEQVKIELVGKKTKPLSREDIANDEYLREQIKFDRSGRPTVRLSSSTVFILEHIFNAKTRVKQYDDGRRYRADDGHFVRSKGELEIDNWLYKNRIVHAYETMIPGAKRCDFEIPTETGPIYIEFWGLNHKHYLKDKAVKQKIYREHNLKLIEVEPEDLKNLDNILAGLNR